MEQTVKLLLAKANDCVRLAELRSVPKFTGFLSPGEAAEIAQAIRAPGTLFYGGYADAERRMFGALPDYITEPEQTFPIRAIRFSYRSADTLSHRDVLGAVMATGLSRDRIGDIRFGEAAAIVFVAEEVAPYLLEQITTIGRVGVKAEALSLESVCDVLPPPKRKELSFTVSSARLDAVVSGLVGCGRSKAEQWIEEGLVFVNAFAVTKSTRHVQANDQISIRGVGKFVITAFAGLSKKGREIITAEQYI